jgi:phage internal scaffolding protein
MVEKRKRVPPELRAPGNYDTDEASREADTQVEGPSLTVQSQAAETDINLIVKRFGVTGELPMNRRVPLNLAYYENVDYRECLDAVRNAERAFGDLPATIRERFHNDPGALVQFMNDASNLDEARALGILPPAAPQEPSGAPG